MTKEELDAIEARGIEDLENEHVRKLVAEVRRLQAAHERLRLGLARMKKLGVDAVLIREVWDAPAFREQWLAERRKALASSIRNRADEIASLAAFAINEDAHEVRMHWRLSFGPPVQERSEQPPAFLLSIASPPPP